MTELKHLSKNNTISPIMPIDKRYKLVNGNLYLLKGKKAQIGEVRNRKGGPHKKVAEGKWVPVSGKGAKPASTADGTAKEGIGRGEYSLHGEEGHTKVPGKKIEIHPDHHTFAYKQKGEYKISDADTGKVVGSGSSLEEASEMAEAYLGSDKYGIRKKAHIEKHGKSPGFKDDEEITKLKGQNEKLQSQVDEMSKKIDGFESMFRKIQSGISQGERVGGTLADGGIREVVGTGLSGAAGLSGTKKDPKVKKTQKEDPKNKKPKDEETKKKKEPPKNEDTKKKNPPKKEPKTIAKSNWTDFFNNLGTKIKNGLQK